MRVDVTRVSAGTAYYGLYSWYKRSLGLSLRNIAEMPAKRLLRYTKEYAGRLTQKTKP
jgi:hypothetical protein